MKLLAPALALFAHTVMTAQANAAAFSSQEVEVVHDALTDVLFR